VSTAAPSVVVVGSINVDLIASTARLPAPGETVGRGVLSRQPGGKGANQAVAAARLGATVRMVGAVGRDADGDWVLAGLDAAGIDTAAVARTDLATGTALIVVDEHGENQITVCPGANAAVSLAGSRLTAQDAVVTQLEIELEVVLELAASVPGYLALNASPARTLPAELVARADLVVVNEAEFAAMPELRDARQVAVTYGARGAALLRSGTQVAWADAVPVRAVSSVGAGDAFCAALVLALRSGVPDADALGAACRVGGDAAAHPSSQPDLQHLSAYL